MPCNPTSCSASFTSSSLNGLMMASIFFTERLAGTSIFQTAGFTLRKGAQLVRFFGHTHSLPMSATLQSAFLKSRVYAKLPERLILKRYQAINGALVTVGPKAAA